MRLAAIEIEHEQRDGLGREAGRLERFNAHAAEDDRVVIAQGDVRVLGPGFGAETDPRTGPIAELEMPCQEVGVQVGQEHVRDVQPVFAGEHQILLHVALRVDDRRRARSLVAHHVRRVCKTIEIELPENHGCDLCLSRARGES